MFRLFIFCMLIYVGMCMTTVDKIMHGLNDPPIPVSNSIELDAKNWIKKTAGKTLFVYFCEPYLPNCRRLRPIWNKAAKKYKDHPDILMAHVNCETKGKAICKKFNIGRIKPEIRYGHPENLKKVEEDLRDPTEQKLEQFVSNMDLVCSIQNLKACSTVDKHRIVSLAKLSVRELTARVRTYHREQDNITQTFKNDSIALKHQYYALEEQYHKDLDELHDKNYIHLIQDVLSKLVGDIDPMLLAADKLSAEEESISL